jgi:ABC-type nitrate/sulfonate/bicarbonate transport system permease component
MYAAVLCLAALGYALNRGFTFLEDRLVAWDRRGDVSA